MEASRQFSVDDLWRSGDPLPGKGILTAITERCAAAWGMPDLAASAKVAYNPRLRTTLGRAELAKRRVELNTGLLHKHPDELIPTLVHELAHVAVHMRYGPTQPHGRHFRVLMRSLNLSAKATHSLAVDGLKRPRRRYLYLHCCDDCGVTFVARSVRRGTHCAACGPEMRWDVYRAPSGREGRRKLEQFRRQLARQRVVAS